MNPLGALALATLRAYSHLAPTQRGGYRLARLARKFIPRHQWQNTFTTPDGTKLNLDLATYPDCCMAVGLYELDTLRLLRQLLKPGHHFVDCGANIGYFTLAAAKLVGPTGQVDAIEPDPQNRARLEAHLAANGASTNVKIHPLALSNTPGHATLYHPTNPTQNHGEASLFPSSTPAQQYTVETARLDQILHHPPNVIKMDIEGAELNALKGITTLLTAPNPPHLIIEHNPDSATAAGHRPGDLMRLIQSNNPKYNAHWIARRLIKLSSPNQIDALSPQGNILYRP